MSAGRSEDFETEPLTDDVLAEAIGFIRSANPFAQHTWGWDAGRFIDFRWGGNILREEAAPGFFERNGTLVRRSADGNEGGEGGEIVTLVLAESGGDQRCILTAGEDPDMLDWALRDLLQRQEPQERQGGDPIVLLPSDDADWVRQEGEGDDWICLFVTTLGAGIRQWGTELKDAGEYLRSHAVQALALEGAEAYAEWLHARIRADWGFADPEDLTMADRFRSRYRGVRVSFGYPACPELEHQEILWRLLRPEEIGVDRACGWSALCGLLHLARARGLRAHTVDLRCSADAGGPRNRVVGYGAWVFLEPDRSPDSPGTST